MRRIEIIKEGSINHFIYPTSWEEVTVAQYVGLFELPEGLDPLDRAVWAMTYFTNISEDDLYGMQMSEINLIARELEFIHATAPHSVNDVVEAGGWRWRRRTQWDNITYGEVVSMQTIAGGSMLKSLPKLLCILLERIDADDNVIPFSTDAMSAEADFAAMSITKVMGVLENFPSGIVG